MKILVKERVALLLKRDEAEGSGYFVLVICVFRFPALSFSLVFCNCSCYILVVNNRLGHCS